MCSILEVSENGYCNWLKRGKIQRKQDYEQSVYVLKMLIMRIGVFMVVLVFMPRDPHKAYGVEENE